MALTIAASSLLANDTDPDGDTLSIASVSAALPTGSNVAYNATARTVLFTPATGYSGQASFLYTISDGRGGTASQTVTVNVLPNAVPVAANDTGSDLTTLRDTTLSIPIARLLANDTDANGDTLSIAALSAPSNGTVAINGANVVFTPTSGYTGNAGFSYTVSDGQGGTSTAAAVALTVTAPATGATLFTTSDIPNATADSDASPVELGMKFVASSSGTITGVRYYKSATDIGTHTGALWTSTGTLLASGTFVNETSSGWQTLSFATPVTITAGTTYVAGYHSNGHYIANSNYFSTAKVNGSLTAPASGTSGGNGIYAYGASNVFPTGSFNNTNYWVDVLYNQAPGSNAQPVAVNDGPYATATNTAFTISQAALLANDSDPNNDPLSITGTSTVLNGALTVNGTSYVFTPTNNFTGTGSFNYAISDGKGGTASATVTIAVGSQPTENFFSASTVPATPNVVDPGSVELGLRFTTDVAGQITAIKFYKGTSNTGPHSASLWSATGTLLASATFTNETASGWQTATLSTPVNVQANTAYVASYHTSSGYAAAANFFATPLEVADLNATGGGNGVYTYGASSVFPTSSFNNSNYYVDVAFKPQLAVG